MRRLIAFALVCACVLCAFGAPAENTDLGEPDYVLEGYDGGASHDWETNLFFTRMQEKTGIRFQLRQYTDSDAWDERKGSIAAGEDLPDVLFKAQLTASEIQEMSESGVLIDLTPYLQEYAPDLWAMLEADEELKAAITLPDGKITALPAVNELPNNELVWINTTWLKNLGLEKPTTADELTEVLKAFRDGDPNRNGKADEVPLTFLGMWELRFLAHAFGIIDNDYYVTCKDGTVTSSLGSEEQKAFLEWLNLLWDEKLLDHQGFSTLDSLRQVTDSDATVTYGVILSTTPLTVLPTTALSQYETLDPMMYEGTQVYRDLLGEVTLGTFAITSACKEPEKLVAWVNELYTSEGSLMLQVGLEGEEYLWNENGEWEWMDDLTTVAEDVIPNRTLSDGGIAPGIIELDFQMKYADSDTKKLLTWMARQREFAVSPYPLVYLSGEDRARIHELQLPLSQYVEKTTAAFVTGDIEITDDSWAEFTAKIQELGLSEMIEIWQKYAR